jgi:cytochrome P450/NADPH-cytochrome P450 reductase
LQIEVIASGALRARLLRQSDAGMGRVLENWKLTREGAPVKRHIDIELPEGMSYQAGDYLAM